MEIFNHSDRDLFFRLEPWADEKIISSKGTVVIELSGPIEGTVAIELDDQQVTLSGWSGSTCYVAEEL
jgi:hypothetical protein